jgi:VCBS repeat-containing protein
VFEGVTSDNMASFLVSADVTADGDGTCAPSATECDTLTLGTGQSETFTLTLQGGKKVDMSITAIGKKDFPVSGSGSRVESVRLQNKARAIGARAVKDAIQNPIVANALFKSGVRFH